MLQDDISEILTRTVAHFIRVLDATLEVSTIDIAKECIEWYSWRWIIQEVFKIVKRKYIT